MNAFRSVPGWRRALLALCCGATLAPGLLAAEDPLVEALQCYERNQWPQAFAALSELADGGNAEAARIAALMWRYGRMLYGVEFQASASQVARWQALASAAATSQVADLQLPRSAP